ncbi:MAG: vWA domain-containing protein [Gemmataceae bacterium]|jgi:hypothetical protein
MNMDLVEIACVVDRSGSMESICSDAIGGFNSFLADQKTQPGSTKFTLVLFDNEYQVIHNGTDIKLVKGLNTHTFVPRGSTALLDAIGKTIDDMGSRLSQTAEADRPGKVILAILTDGEENSSIIYTREKVAGMIRHQQEQYKWDVIFLAANQDAILAARELEIPIENAMNFSSSGEGVKMAFSALNTNINQRRESHRSQKSKGTK